MLVLPTDTAASLLGWHFVYKLRPGRFYFKSCGCENEFPRGHNIQKQLQGKDRPQLSPAPWPSEAHSRTTALGQASPQPRTLALQGEDQSLHLKLPLATEDGRYRCALGLAVLLRRTGTKEARDPGSMRAKQPPSRPQAHCSTVHVFRPFL